MTESGGRRGWAMLAGAMACAAGCAALGAGVSTQWWAEWFTHPLTGTWQDRVEGARLLRVMLWVSSAAIAAWAVVMQRAGRSGRPCAGGGTEACSTAGGGEKTARWEAWAVAGAVTAALMLRMMRVGESLWYDEVASWLSYGVGVESPGPIVGNYFDPVNHIFHTVLSWGSVVTFSEAAGDAPAMRLPALFFSVLTVVVMWRLGRAVCGTRAGVLAAWLSAVLPVLVLEGVEARGYSMMMFFTALSTWMLAETWRKPCGWRCGVFVLAHVLGVWSQFVTAFAAMGQCAWMVWRGVGRREWSRMGMGFTSVALAGVLSLTAVSPVIPDLRKQQGVFTSSRGDEPRVMGAEGRHALMQMGGAWYWWSAIPGLVLASIGIARRGAQNRVPRTQEEGKPSPCPLPFIMGEGEERPLRREGEGGGKPSPCPLPLNMGEGEEVSSRGRLPREGGEGYESHAVNARDVGAMAVMGLLFFVAVITIAGSWMYARFVLFSVPGAVVVMGSGIEWLWKRNAWTGVGACVVVAGVSCAELWVRPAKQPLREAMEMVREGGGRKVVVVGLAHEVMRAYAGRDVEVVYSLRHGEDAGEKLSSTGAEWVVVEYPDFVKREVWEELRKRGFEEVTRLEGWADWGKGDLVVMRRR